MRIVAALLLALALLPGHAVAKKEPPLTEEERNVVQVFEAEGYTKDQIYSASKMWIAENFKSAKAVTEYESPEEGTIVGNGNIGYPCTGGFACSIRAGAWRVGFTMKLESKDGRFRLTFTNVVIQYPASMYGPAHDQAVKSREDMDNIRAKLLEFGPQIVASLGKAKGSDDW